MDAHRKLATLLLDYSLKTQPGDKLYLEVKGKESLTLAKAIIAEATAREVTPFWFYNDESLQRHFIAEATEQQIRDYATMHLGLMQQADCFISVRGSDNPYDLADITDSQMKRFNKLFYTPVHLEERINNTRWVVLRYPNNAMAQLAELPQEHFERFFFEVCLVNYEKMSEGLSLLKDKMERADQVRITGPETDLTFSIKGIPVIPCTGRNNIPDGEIFTAPVRDSINGTIRYNAPSIYQGTLFQDIFFRFKNGKIVESSCSGDSAKLAAILDSDEGARYVGEFAIGVNPFVKRPIKDTLFDEKIAGSIHLTPGQAYEDADNGNDSSIHWDLVFIQTPEYGGGELIFDGELIRKDGEFVDPTLRRLLSAENLAGD